MFVIAIHFAFPQAQVNLVCNIPLCKSTNNNQYKEIAIINTIVEYIDICKIKWMLVLSF